MSKTVRVTLELPSSFINLLNAKATLSGWTKLATGDDHPELDAGSIVAWLVLNEARGSIEAEIHAATPMMWRDSECPELIHEERRVYEDGELISGPQLAIVNT